jgi:sugar phosphate isomerase/epimerase
MIDSNIVLCSTGIITHFPDFPSHWPIIENRSKIHADHYELMVYPTWYEHIGEILADFKKENMSFPVVHADKRFGSRICDKGSVEYGRALDTFSLDCSIAKRVGASFVVLHLWGLPCSDRNFATNLAALGNCIRIAEQHEIGLSVEPIYCSSRSPLSNFYDIHREYPSVGITLDLRILGYHDEIRKLYQTEWIWEKELRHFHMTDYAGPAYNMNGGTHPGHGEIDFDQLFSFLADRKFIGSFTMEAASLDGDGRIQIQRLNESLDFVKRRVAELDRTVRGAPEQSETD